MAQGKDITSSSDDPRRTIIIRRLMNPRIFMIISSIESAQFTSVLTSLPRKH